LAFAALALVIFGAYDSYPSHTCFGCQGKTGEERNSGIFEDKPINNHIN